jgi:hypothetical protein
MPKKTQKDSPPNLLYSPVLVFWVDSCEPINNSEVEKHDVPEPQKITQCGFLIKETDEYISIAGAVKEDPEVYDYVITIPKFAVTKLVKL